MESHQDEQLICAACGTSFVFPAELAAARKERGITTPPTHCKACWREKKAKENASKDEQNAEHAPTRGAPRRPLGGGERGHRPRPVRYTGDVNEYRSPMQDPHFPSHGAYARPHYGRPRGRTGQDDRNYRAPSFRDEQPQALGPRQTPRSGAPARQQNGPSYPITCAACGAKATVPFKPNENQKVFCRACYRAEKPS